jgi:SAM-dependent methyltransferase
MFRFLDLELMTMPIYQDVISRLKTKNQTFLDLGCCFGQELRELVFDGAPAQNLFGTDLRQGLIDMGYELFRDKETLKSTFIAADVFDDESELVKQLSGKINIIYTGSFFHLFDYAQQKAVGKRVIQLLKPEKDSFVIGRQIGNVDSGDHTTEVHKLKRTRFRHNAESWRNMWKELGEETGTTWDVNVELDERWMKEGSASALTMFQRESGGSRRLRFIVKRVG